jgi:hypothetical protein
MEHKNILIIAARQNQNLFAAQWTKSAKTISKLKAAL